MTAEQKYAVGQKLWIEDVNRRGRDRESVEVVKVGRKLVTVLRYGRRETYRIEDGVRNDAYHHSRLMTDADVAAHDAAMEVAGRLRVMDVDLGRRHRWSTATRRSVADLLEAAIAAEEVTA